MLSSINPKDTASYGEVLEALHTQQKMTANLAKFQDIVYELATTHQRQGDICLGCPSSMTATDGVIYRKYSECSVAKIIEKHKITPNLMTRHDMGIQINRLTNKINKLEEEQKSYCEVVESTCTLDPCPIKQLCARAGFTEPSAHQQLPHHLKDWSREEEKNIEQ